MKYKVFVPICGYRTFITEADSSIEAKINVHKSIGTKQEKAVGDHIEYQSVGILDKDWQAEIIKEVK